MGIGFRSQNSSRFMVNRVGKQYVSSRTTWTQLLTRKKREAVVHRCSVKKVFLEISQNSQENTSARVYFLIKLLALFKKRLYKG